MLFQDYHAIGEIKFPSTLSKGWWFPKATPLVAHRSERNLPSPGRRICSKPSLRTQLTSRPPPSFPLSPSHPRPRRLCRQANRSRLHLSPGLSVPAPSRQRPTFVGLVPCLAARKRKAHRGSAPMYNLYRSKAPIQIWRCHQGSLGGRRTLRMLAFSPPL